MVGSRIDKVVELPSESEEVRPVPSSDSTPASTESSRPAIDGRYSSR